MGSLSASDSALPAVHVGFGREVARAVLSGWIRRGGCHNVEAGQIMPSSSSSTKKTKSASAQVREYFAALPPDSRRQLKQLRDAIRSAASNAEDAFSYRIPAFRLDGQPLVWYAAFKNHCSLYPMTAAIRKAHAADLESYDTSKGTVRFPRARALPVRLIRRLVKSRVKELAAKS
jgi:uncharacterized protein YdhG (YjbR/CyaY superfamily)